MSRPTGLRWPTLTVRLRLALLLGAGLVAGGALLLALTYVLVSHVLPQDHFPFSRPLDIARAFRDSPLHRMPTSQELAALRHALRPALQPALQSQRREFVGRLLLGSGIALFALSLAAGLIAWFTAGHLLRPLRRMTDTARRLSGNNLGERIALAGPKDELRELADTFDDMLDRLTSAFSAQRQFVANASHELHTPLAVQRALLEVALADPLASAEDLRRAAERALRVNERSERLIDGLLLLARTGGRVSGDRLDLADLARDALLTAASEAAQSGLRVDRDLSPAPVQGDRELLWRMVGNLVENAVRHNRPGGFVRVSVHPTPEGARLTVENSGDAIAAEHAETLFEPFRRLHGRTRSDRGAGLGLSIVRSVVAAHGGTVQFAPRGEGGARVEVLLPRAGAAQEH